ncbi:hypothetical protein SteCoe_4457 [Stentor coeruleus]|uniref:RING-type domain-containing protein n=1 Tax=Stentor coeruleus TaxID=5963 RepID=A0A1R2CUT0_9CILI|nr:hypothetical protein SteCoe_4457 [Stentor coeruleus]
MEQLTCWVCCKDLGFHALGACGHNDMCLYCACRLRILLKDYKCPICKTNLPKVLITKNPNAKLEDYPELEVCKNDYGILCDSPEAQEAFSKIQSFNCWLPSCRNPKNHTLAQLTKHIDSHKLKFCRTCLNGRLIFIWEQKVYTNQDLKKHLQFGDEDIPPHRQCLFCNSMYYDESELRSHLESKHYFCNVCEGKSYVYYEDYEKLKLHFQKSHYMCHDPSCAESRFTVFKTPYELQAHTYNIHTDKDKLSKAQKQQFTSIQILEEEPLRPNTEGIDFSGQFTVKKINEEDKHGKNSKNYKTKNYVVKKKKQEIVDYKTLPKQAEKEVIQMIKESMAHNPTNYDQFKSFAIQFNKCQIAAEVLLKKFIELAGINQGEILFPVLITTLKSNDKQEELHREYVKYMEGKQNVSSDGKCCNKFSDCTYDASLFRVLTEVIEAELSSRPEEKTKKALFMHPSQLIQMAAIIDRMQLGDMCRLMFIMNFGVIDKAKSSILSMIERANDKEFNESLQVKYESFFLKDIESQHLYVIHKYSEMCLAKLQGRPLKEDSKLLNNWDETKTAKKIEEEEAEEEEKKDEKNWASVLVKKSAKAPSNIEKNFPSLASSMPNEHKTWGKGQKIGYSAKPGGNYPASSVYPTIESTFPSLENSFPTLATEQSHKKVVEEKVEIPSNPIIINNQTPNELEFLKEKGFHVTQSKRNRKKKGK